MPRLFSSYTLEADGFMIEKVETSTWSYQGGGEAGHGQGTWLGQAEAPINLVKETTEYFL